MKIIFGATSFDRDKQAQQLLRKMAKRERDPRNGDYTLVGIPMRLARTISRCDTCGNFYWEPVDAYMSHNDCPGPPRGKAGF